MRRARNRAKRVVIQDWGVLSYRYRPSYLIDGIDKNFPEKWVEISAKLKNRKTKKISLKNFSFIDHPKETLSTIKEIVDASSYCIDIRLAFDDLN
jgi:pyruvate/oxaloacetate carboxyltransferase